MLCARITLINHPNTTMQNRANGVVVLCEVTMFEKEQNKKKGGGISLQTKDWGSGN